MTDLFSSPVLRVEQPRKVLQTQTQFNFYDANGVLLAVATDTTVRSRRKAARAALPGNVLSGQQTLLVRSADEVPLLLIEKQEGKRLTHVRLPGGGGGNGVGDGDGDGDVEGNGVEPGELIGSIRAERTTRHYSLLDAGNQKLGEVTGDLGLRKFVINDADRKRVGQVTKKWAGLAAEVLTTADRYAVEISKPVTGPLRTLIVVTAVVLDLTLHESKDVV